MSEKSIEPGMLDDIRRNHELFVRLRFAPLISCQNQPQVCGGASFGLNGQSVLGLYGQDALADPTKMAQRSFAAPL